MKLFSFWRSLATYRVRIALNLKGLTPEVIEVNLLKGHQRDPKFRAVNPMMAIPALVDGDGPALFESLAIIEYLDETHPNPPLMPKEPKARARVRGLSQIVACDSHPLIVPRVREYLAHEFKVDEAGVMKWAQHWHQAALSATRGASFDRKGNRHLLPGRADHDRGYLRRQSGRGRKFLQGRPGSIPDGRPHRFDLHEERCVCARPSAQAARRAGRRVVGLA